LALAVDGATDAQLKVYQMSANSLRRLLGVAALVILYLFTRH
jgi:hypothetical protein